MQKIVSGLMLATIIPRMDCSESTMYTSQVLGSRHVRLDVSLCEIKGFVPFGFYDEQILLFQTIDPAADESPACAEHGLNPLVFDIHNNPME